MSDVQWFYEAAGTRLGPVSDEEMKRLVRSNTVGYGTAVWRQGFADWVLCEQSELKEQLVATPPPLKKEALLDVWLWLVALTPLHVLFYGPRVPSPGLMITFMLTIAFCALDIRQVRKAGYKAPSIWWSLLYPVYLFRRARAVKAEQWPFITWLVLFLGPALLFG